MKAIASRTGLPVIMMLSMAIMGCTTPGGGSPSLVQVTIGGRALQSGETYDFGSVQVGSIGIPVQCTVKNLGAESLDLNAIETVRLSGLHSESFIEEIPPTLPPAAQGESSSFTLAFYPSVAGTLTAQLSLQNLSGTLFTCYLTGTGT